MPKLFGVLVYVFLFCMVMVNCQSSNNIEDETGEDMVISPAESIYLTELKQLVLKDLNNDYMNKDVYLINWLRSTNLNVKETAFKIRKMLEWRKVEKIDGILDEDFSDFEGMLPFTNDGFDLIGRPVGTADVEEWDARKIVLSGRMERAIRYIFRMAELGVVKVMEAHTKNPNITSGILLANLKGFNTKTHGCPQCLPIYRNLLVTMDQYFPNMVYKFIGINTPMSFYSVFRVFLPLLSRQSLRVVRLYGINKSQWSAAILSLIAPDQLEPQFGGTKKRESESD